MKYKSQNSYHVSDMTITAGSCMGPEKNGVKAWMDPGDATGRTTNPDDPRASGPIRARTRFPKSPGLTRLLAFVLWP